MRVKPEMALTNRLHAFKPISRLSDYFFNTLDTEVIFACVFFEGEKDKHIYEEIPTDRKSVKG